VIPWNFDDAIGSPWITHGFSMEKPWRIHMAKNPWKTYGFLS